MNVAKPVDINKTAHVECKLLTDHSGKCSVNWTVVIPGTEFTSRVVIGCFNEDGANRVATAINGNASWIRLA